MIKKPPPLKILLTSPPHPLYCIRLDAMKTLSLLSVLFAAAAFSSVQAAPAVQSSDISESSLRSVATERQKASLDQYNEARKRADKKRDDEAKEAQDLTTRNDNGLKKTIQRRHLNSMLPACEREPEVPREPGNYEIRY